MIMIINLPPVFQGFHIYLLNLMSTFSKDLHKRRVSFLHDINIHDQKYSKKENAHFCNGLWWFHYHKGFPNIGSIYVNHTNLLQITKLAEILFPVKICEIKTW